MKLNTPCIETTYCKNSLGYGRASNPDKVPRMVLHHRLVYAQTNNIKLSSIDNLVVRHKCDNPSCINPEHLELGTVKDNTTDMIVRGRKPVQLGEAHGKAKFTNEDILFIRSAKSLTTKQLMVRFGVAKSTIDNILSRRTWKHI